MASIHLYFARKQVGDTPKRGKLEMRSYCRNSLDLHWSAAARPGRGSASVPHLGYLSVSRHKIRPLFQSWDIEIKLDCASVQKSAKSRHRANLVILHDTNRVLISCIIEVAGFSFFFFFWPARVVGRAVTRNGQSSLDLCCCQTHSYTNQIVFERLTQKHRNANRH